MGKSRPEDYNRGNRGIQASRIAFANTMSSKDKKNSKLDEFPQREMPDDPAELVRAFGRVNRKRIAEARVAKTRKQLR